MTDRDIAERLRALAEEWSLRSYTVSHALHESADAIDALRAEVAQVREYADALNARCIEDTAELGRLRTEVARLTERAETAEAERDAMRADAERMDFMQANPTLSLRHRKGRWALVGFTSYEFDMHPTLRAAIDAARAQEAER